MYRMCQKANKGKREKKKQLPTPHMPILFTVVCLKPKQSPLWTLISELLTLQPIPKKKKKKKKNLIALFDNSTS